MCFPLSLFKCSSSDHEYGQQMSTPQQQKRTIYLTPSSSSGGGPSSGVRGGSATASHHILVPNSQVKPEARRRLNLDSAPVDQEGFKTPIKASKRRAPDYSSPSPKKSKSTSPTFPKDLLLFLECFFLIFVFSDSSLPSGEDSL